MVALFFLGPRDGLTRVVPAFKTVIALFVQTQTADFERAMFSRLLLNNITLQSAMVTSKR
jgi:hypothetical protein